MKLDELLTRPFASYGALIRFHARERPEAVLIQHPAVSEAAVVGVASSRWGETPVAFVVTGVGADGTPTDLREWANQRLGKTQRLAAVVIVDALPRSAIGKILKRELRKTYLPPGDL